VVGSVVVVVGSVVVVVASVIVEEEVDPFVFPLIANSKTNTISVSFMAIVAFLCEWNIHIHRSSKTTVGISLTFFILGRSWQLLENKIIKLLVLIWPLVLMSSERISKLVFNYVFY
jgi:hypothetical protein